MNEEILPVQLRSLDDSLPPHFFISPSESEGEAKVNREEMLDILRDFSQTLGVVWSESYGKYMIEESKIFFFFLSSTTYHHHLVMNKYDVNNDGYISKSEMDQILKRYKQV
jgi:hypothetical protein